MDQPILDTEAGELLDVFDLPGQVVVAELSHEDQLTFTAWHTISPDDADRLAGKLLAASARARQ